MQPSSHSVTLMRGVPKYNTFWKYSISWKLTNTHPMTANSWGIVEGSLMPVDLITE